MPAATRTPRGQWIDAGLNALAAGGPDAVRVDVLAKTLGVTRGGFYWHFADRQALLDAMLETWERRSTDEVLERVESEGGDARDKVRRAGTPVGPTRTRHLSGVGPRSGIERSVRAVLGAHDL